jgi:hypothetical protein
MTTHFFLIFLLTIVITRLVIFLRPIPSPTIKGFRLHHYMYGIVLILVSIFLSNIILYAIGWGLFIDELTYLIVGGRTHEDNYSKTSLLGTLFFIIVVFFLQNYLILPLVSS